MIECSPIGKNSMLNMERNGHSQADVLQAECHSFNDLLAYKNSIFLHK